MTPCEAYDEDDLSGEAPFLPPRAFRQWLSVVFVATMPARALIAIAPDMDDPDPTEPFLSWS